MSYLTDVHVFIPFYNLDIRVKLGVSHAKQSSE